MSVKYDPILGKLRENDSGNGGFASYVDLTGTSIALQAVPNVIYRITSNSASPTITFPAVTGDGAPVIELEIDCTSAAGFLLPDNTVIWWADSDGKFSASNDSPIVSPGSVYMFVFRWNKTKQRWFSNAWGEC